MTAHLSRALVVLGLAATVVCSPAAPPVDAAADEAAVSAINPTWFKAYNAGDADGVAALYADDAVVSPPGVAPARGRAAIRDYFAKDIAASAEGGYTFGAGASPEVAVSGDLGWEWNTFTVTDKAGATVDKGTYVTVYGRRDGKWLIVRDIWNSDMPPAPPAPATPPPA